MAKKQPEVNHYAILSRRPAFEANGGFAVPQAEEIKDVVNNDGESVTGTPDPSAKAKSKQNSGS